VIVLVLSGLVLACLFFSGIALPCLKACMSQIFVSYLQDIIWGSLGELIGDGVIGVRSGDKNKANIKIKTKTI
jgi:hypothetical protein